VMMHGLSLFPSHWNIKLEKMKNCKHISKNLWFSNSIYTIFHSKNIKIILVFTFWASHVSYK
jgi:hypothetical protein